MPIRFIQFVLVLTVFAVANLCSSHCARSAETNTLSPEEIADGWILLFDGETLFGWTPGSDANWKAHDGMISVTDGKGGLLCTNTEFADYQLHVDFRSPADTNSGVFLRTKLKPKSVKDECYELNIAPQSNPFPTGGFVQRQRAEGANPKADEWNSFDVTAEGGHFVVKLNDKQVLDYTDPKPTLRGLIGLQRNEGSADFRNIKLKPLGLKSLFNGHDLAGWKPTPGSKSVATVTPEGWINVKNGSGSLESDGQFGDFVLQLDAISNEKNSNSGVFFRSIPGQRMNGYECQIHNGYKNNDRGQPSDGGTGAIYRRQSARKVVPNDMEWFSETLIATGKHMACWINGYQVTDVVDTREPSENPREGSRTAAGTLQLQGHDAKTNASFRNLRAVELPAVAEK
jgi:hypothetical protein